MIGLWMECLRSAATGERAPMDGIRGGRTWGGGEHGFEEPGNAFVLLGARQSWPIGTRGAGSGGFGGRRPGLIGRAGSSLRRAAVGRAGTKPTCRNSSVSISAAEPDNIIDQPDSCGRRP